MVNGVGGIAQLIARPQVADIPGAVATGQQRAQQNVLFGQQQQELARQQQVRGLAGAALGQQLPENLQELGRVDPDVALKLFNKLGVIGQANQDQFKSDIGVLSRLSTNPQLLSSQLDSIIQRNQAQGIDSSNLLQVKQDLATDPQGTIGEINQLNSALSPVAQKVGLASAKTEILEDGSAIQGLPSGEVIVRDPSGQIVEGQARLDVLKQASATKFRRQEKEAGLAVSEAQRIAAAGEREKRVSSLKTELSTRNRNAARSRVRVRGALKVAGQATQGIRGTVKLKLAKVFPDIDVTNEALLDQTLKQLALDELQNFKGPTTDFEFGVTEQIAGAIGDPTTANIARLKSLDRATWFNRREFEQFNQHVKAGGDPDDFAFDFNEKVRTGKGLHSLQDLQDTAVFHNLTIEEVIKRLSK